MQHVGCLTSGWSRFETRLGWWGKRIGVRRVIVRCDVWVVYDGLRDKASLSAPSCLILLFVLRHGIGPTRLGRSIGVFVE